MGQERRARQIGNKQKRRPVPDCAPYKVSTALGTPATDKESTARPFTQSRGVSNATSPLILGKAPVNGPDLRPLTPKGNRVSRVCGRRLLWKQGLEDPEDDHPG